MTPFVILGLPRSRTYWLSHFLTYGDYECRHETAALMRTVDDLKSWVNQDFTGTAETGAAPGWRLIQHYRPDIRILVVRRPVEEVTESLMNLDLRDIAVYERGLVRKTMAYLDRYLDQIEAEAANVLSVGFHDLEREDVCRAAFEHCLPYHFDRRHWERYAPLRLTVNSRALMRYRFAHRRQMNDFKSACWRELRRLRAQGVELRKAA